MANNNIIVFAQLKRFSSYFGLFFEPENGILEPMRNLVVGPRRRVKGPVVLAVLDGFGVSEKDLGNAILHARMPNFRALKKAYPNSLLSADGESVGLPVEQPGNSEAGHATIGAGRPVETDLVRINRSIEDRSFFDNPAFLQAAAHVIRNKSTLHLVGLLTNHRSGHASPKHLKALIAFAEGLRLPRVALHLITDGRDTHPFQALTLLEDLKKTLPKSFVIATLIGRFYAMDRNRFWERTELAYNLIANGEGVVATDPIHALSEAYARGEGDEFLLPTVLCHDNNTCIAPLLDHDAMIFWNLRSDRARQLIKPFVEREFETKEPGAFRRRVFRKDIWSVSMTEFGTDLDHVVPAYPHRQISNTLVEVLRYHKQLYAAESEKFSQVTYFFNGGVDRPRFGEDRIRVPSPRVAKYDSKPRMSADELTKRVVAALDGQEDFVLVNYANADMVGHTGDFDAGIVACEALDDNLGRLWKKVSAKHGMLIVTGDHGNIEQMLLAHGGTDTEHNPNPVPLLMAGSVAKGKTLRRGTLADLAPTVLHLLGLAKPKEMTGRNLLN